MSLMLVALQLFAFIFERSSVAYFGPALISRLSMEIVGLTVFFYVGGKAGVLLFSNLFLREKSKINVISELASTRVGAPWRYRSAP